MKHKLMYHSFKNHKDLKNTLLKIIKLLQYQFNLSMHIILIKMIMIKQ